jgi:hypothetical protein
VPEGDRALLIEFAVSLQRFVGDGLSRHREELSGDALDDLLTAWHLQEERFARLVQVLSLDPDVAPTDPDDVDRRLTEAGLIGPELRLKLRLYDEAVEAYEVTPTPSRFGTALSAADITLGSVARVFTWMDPVKETKEAIEFLFSWGRGWFRRRFRKRGRR